MKIGIDVDDVLLDTLATAWLPTFNDKTGLDIKPTDITEWNITKFVPEEYHKLIYELLNAEELWDHVRPIPEAQKYLKKLNDDPDIELFIVSATSVSTTRRKWEKFFEYFPFIKPEQIILMFDKKNLPEDMLMVDDKLDNLRYWDMLFTRPHNLECDRTNPFMMHCVFRVDTWKDVYANIMSRMQALTDDDKKHSA